MENVVKQTNEMPKEIWAWKGFQDNGSWDKEPCSCCISHKYTRTETINQWQPIETAPLDGTQIDLYAENPKVRIPDCRFDIDSGEWECWFEGKGFLPIDLMFTHWMPLPDAPKKDVER